MSDNETAERWTVPQACVWIYSRDLSTVRELDPRAARSLTVAALAMPGVYSASGCLVAALRAGRFAASGRLVRPQVGIAGAAPDLILGEGRERIPQEFWQDGGDLSDDLDSGVTARESGGAGRWIDLDIEADDCIGTWQWPAAFLGDGPLSLQQALECIEPAPIDCPAWLLTHPAVVVTGLNDRAERPEPMTIARAALARATIDAAADTVTVTTRDGRLCWAAVMVELAPAADVAREAAAGTTPANATDNKSTPRRRGPAARRRNAVVDWIAEHYPDDVPEDVTIAALQTEMKADTAACDLVRSASEDTIRRARGLKK